jgi:hypothetical protein
MEDPSPLTNGLLEFLGEPPVLDAHANPTTLIQQAQVAEAWLFKVYLGSWLELIGGLVGAGYPLATAFQPSLRAISRLAERLVPGLPVTNQVVLLQSVQTYLRSTLKLMHLYPEERGLQWGIWARDVPMAIAWGFDETDYLDALICKDIAPCVMYAALLVSEVVTDDGVAEEISEKMFGELPRSLVELLRAVPAAPEA